MEVWKQAPEQVDETPGKELVEGMAQRLLDKGWPIPASIVGSAADDLAASLGQLTPQEKGFRQKDFPGRRVNTETRPG